MSHKDKIKQRIVSLQDDLMYCLKLMDKLECRSLLVLDDDKCFASILSIGDIQRAIIKNLPLNTLVSDVLRKNPKIAHTNTPLELIREQMLEYRMEFMPVVDSYNKILEIYFWEELFGDRKLPPKREFDLPVVIMAGGLGSRLRPLTNVLPKPLIPINEKSIIEEIICRFSQHGCKNFFISVNYKADLIEFYIRSLNLPYHLEFFRENKPLGTAGSLFLLQNRINTTFFVTNCDILIEQDYSEILEYHQTNKNEVTVIAVVKQFPIHYGTIESGENGTLISLHEKPEMNLKINSGMYILEHHLIKEIPINKTFHITELIEKIRLQNRKIGVFPVSEKSWVDIGDGEKLKKWIF